MTDEERDRKMQMIRRAVSALMEHFDAVQIFATHNDRTSQGQGVTTCYPYGQGNFYCRYGMVRDWIVRTDSESIFRACEEDDWDE